MPPRKSRPRSGDDAAGRLRPSPQAQTDPADESGPADREPPPSPDVLPELPDPEAIEKGEVPEDLPTSRENLPR
jgi:hypothetical protein